jgi:hypothetical protein
VPTCARLRTGRRIGATRRYQLPLEPPPDERPPPNEEPRDDEEREEELDVERVRRGVL